jgi:hypothetical protein
MDLQYYGFGTAKFLKTLKEFLRLSGVIAFKLLPPPPGPLPRREGEQKSSTREES